MNEIVNTFSLAEDKFMPKIHLNSPYLLIVLADHLLKPKKGFENLKEQKIQDIITRCAEINIVCCQHDMGYGDFKDLARRAGFDKVLRDKAFNIATNPQYDGYQRDLASMVYKFSDK